MSEEKLSKQQIKEFQDRTDLNNLFVRLNKSEYERMYYYLEARRIAKEFHIAVQEDNQLREAAQSNLVKAIEEAKKGAEEQTGVEATKVDLRVV